MPHKKTKSNPSTVTKITLVYDKLTQSWNIWCREKFIKSCSTSDIELLCGHSLYLDNMILSK